MVRKIPEISKFSQRQNLQDFHKVNTQTIATTTNCSRRLVQEKFQTNMCRLTTRVHMTISVKQQEQKNTIE